MLCMPGNLEALSCTKLIAHAIAKPLQDTDIFWQQLAFMGAGSLPSARPLRIGDR